MSMNCYLFGNNSLTVECAASLVRNDHRIEGIITSEPRVRDWAASHSVPILDPEDHLTSNLSRNPFALLVSVAYLSIIPQDVLRLPRTAAVTFHDGPVHRVRERR